MSLKLIFVVAQYLCFVDNCLSFFPFLLAIILSVLFRLMDLWFIITSLVSSNFANEPQIRSQIYDRYCDFHFLMVNFPFLSITLSVCFFKISIDIPEPVLVSISCSTVWYKKDTHQGYEKPLLNPFHQEFYCQHHVWVDECTINCSEILFSPIWSCDLCILSCVCLLELR